MAGKLKIGAPAPAWTLPDHKGGKAKLSDFRGKWVVLYFYPRDGSPACTTEAREFSEGFPALGKLADVRPHLPSRH